MRQLVVVGRDLIAATRIMDAALSAGYAGLRVDRPEDLPPPDGVAIVLVDWSDRDGSWGDRLRSWRDDGHPSPRVVLYGPHVDLQAHADARRHALGPMLARSRLFSVLPELLVP